MFYGYKNKKYNDKIKKIKKPDDFSTYYLFSGIDNQTVKVKVPASKLKVYKEMFEAGHNGKVSVVSL